MYKEEKYPAYRRYREYKLLQREREKLDRERVRLLDGEMAGSKLFSPIRERVPDQLEKLLTDTLAGCLTFLMESAHSPLKNPPGSRGARESYQQNLRQLEQELKQIINRVIEKNSEETIARFADYRNYMTYEILITNDVLERAKLSRQTGFNSGAEVQIPYLLILISALLMIYNQKTDSTRLVFIDEPFAKMDPGNVKIMLDFMRRQGLQVLFCSPDKTETIGDECEVILPVLRIRAGSMKMGVVQFHERP